MKNLFILKLLIVLMTLPSYAYGFSESTADFIDGEVEYEPDYNAAMRAEILAQLNVEMKKSKAPQEGVKLAQQYTNPEVNGRPWQEAYQDNVDASRNGSLSRQARKEARRSARTILRQVNNDYVRQIRGKYCAATGRRQHTPCR